MCDDTFDRTMEIDHTMTQFEVGNWLTLSKQVKTIQHHVYQIHSCN